MQRKDVIWRVYVVFLLIAGLCVLIISKVFAIQNSGEHQATVETKKEIIQEREIPAFRGTIYSEDGSELAISDLVFDLHWDATVPPDELFNQVSDSLSLMLSEAFPERSISQWKQYLIQGREEGKRYLKIQNKVPHRTYQMVKNFPLFREGQYTGGLIAEKKDERRYQFSLLARRTIGYERSDDAGHTTKVGLEGTYSDELSGVVGQRRMRKSNGRWIPVDDKYIVKPKDGHDLHTTLNMDIQDLAESELKRQLEVQGAAHGCAVLMEVETGYIKAIANLSRTESGGYWETYNHAVGTSSEPGSTFKLASVIVGLEDGAFSLEDLVDTEDGTHKFYDRTMRDSKHGGYGVIPVKRGFAVSSNVLISKLIDEAYRQNPQKYVDGIKKLLGHKTGIDIRGEPDPYIKDANDELWSGVSLPWTSIGYETTFTPLQILTFYNAIANNGVMVRPHLVKEVRNSGNTVKVYEPEIIKRRICSPSTIAKAQHCMELVVSEGTGSKLQGASYTIAGKTGTTQVASGLEGYKSAEKITYQASFCGYFPADNPKYSCIVVIAAPQKGKYGAEVAGTVFKAIADKVHAKNIKDHEAVNETEPIEETSAPITKAGFFPEIKTVLDGVGADYRVDGPADNWMMSESMAGHIDFEKRFIGKTTMPNVNGMGLKDALFILENRNLAVDIKGSGKVISQSVEAGKPIQDNQRVEIVLK